MQERLTEAPGQRRWIILDRRLNRVERTLGRNARFLGQTGSPRDLNDFGFPFQERRTTLIGPFSNMLDFLLRLQVRNPVTVKDT